MKALLQPYIDMSNHKLCLLYISIRYYSTEFGGDMVVDSMNLSHFGTSRKAP